jgi:hypothetical protein
MEIRAEKAAFLLLFPFKVRLIREKIRKKTGKRLESEEKKIDFRQRREKVSSVK